MRKVFHVPRGRPSLCVAINACTEKIYATTCPSKEQMAKLEKYGSLEVFLQISHSRVPEVHAFRKQDQDFFQNRIEGASTSTLSSPPTLRISCFPKLSGILDLCLVYVEKNMCPIMFRNLELISNGEAILQVSGWNLHQRTCR